ncbi:MAG TPA: bacillithiol biosynthesis deacetylase BshB1 [Candidatus Kapabacteria bacterium]|nr:bacillithiol biosynthesis deacetylase BshB1 [Candidatus Kapabacteria bacterium]
MTNIYPSDYDCMIIGAHPDDAELACGGTIAKLTKENKRVVIVDCTEGEMGTRGTNEIRLKEAKAAAKILGVNDRINLGLRDGFVRTDEDSIYKIVQAIRRFRPRAIIVNPPFERHPDHQNTHNLLRDSIFKSGLLKYETEFEGKKQDRYRTKKLFCYEQSYQFPRNPDFFVDTSETHSLKIEAIRAFSSQVFVQGQYENEAKTNLSSPEFMEELESKARYYGGLCGVKYAEAFLSLEPILIPSISSIS